MKSTRALGLALMLTVCVEQALVAQSAIPSLGESIEIAIVNVDVVVTDEKGRRVHGLTREDFEIYENGKLQPVSHFAAYEDGASAGSASVADEATPSPEHRRTMVLFLEDFRLQHFRVEPFIAGLKKLVRETIRPGDSVSLVTFGRSAVVKVPPTDDVTAIERELDAFGKLAAGVMLDTPYIVARELQELRDFDAQAASMGAGQGGIPFKGSSEEELVRSATLHHVFKSDMEMRRRVAAINATIHGMAGIEGKKILVLAAHRLGLYSGAEFYYAAGQNQPPAGESDRFNNTRRLRELIANANSAGVSLYPIFPAGLDQVSIEGPDTTRPVLMNEMAMRLEIAEKTGGLTTYGVSQIVELLPAVADDVSDYYSLAYRATGRGKDQSRNIEVRVKDPKLKTRSRGQFVEKSDDTRMRDRVVAAMYETTLSSAIRVVATIGESKKSGRRKSLPLSVRVPIDALTLVPQGKTNAGAFSVYVMTGAELGAVSEITKRTQSFEIAQADLARAVRSHFTYKLDVLVNAGADHVAVGLLDEVSKSWGVVRLPLPR